MTQDTSAESQPASPPAFKFPKITDWKLALMGEDHIAEYLPLILKSVFDSLPPGEREDETLRANVTGALVDGRVQVWAILGFVPAEKQWRPTGYMTTSMRYDEIPDKKTMLIYTMHSYGVIADVAYGIFFDTLQEYCKIEGCSQIAAYSNNARVLRMLKLLGWNTDFVFAHRDLEAAGG